MKITEIHQKKLIALKTIDELNNGKVTVVCANGREFEGDYSENLQCVFFAIPSNYEIVGYIQD